jgi:hypothetical protein
MALGAGLTIGQPSPAKALPPPPPPPEADPPRPVTTATHLHSGTSSVSCMALGTASTSSLLLAKALVRASTSPKEEYVGRILDFLQQQHGTIRRERLYCQLASTLPKEKERIGQMFGFLHMAARHDISYAQCTAAFFYLLLCRHMLKSTFQGCPQTPPPCCAPAGNMCDPIGGWGALQVSRQMVGCV